MKGDLIASLHRWRWTLAYRFASLSKPAKVILFIILAGQTLLLAGVISFERHAAELRRTVVLSEVIARNPAVNAQVDYGDILNRFNAFLPEASELTGVTASLHSVAGEVGVTLNTLGSQQISGQPTSIVQRQALRLQLLGEQSSVERFILLALLENDALLLRRWSYQAGTGAAATSTLDFELVARP